MTKPESSDQIWTRAEIDSPCVKICVMHRREGLCTGCLRTLDEIQDWSRYSPEQRRTITQDLPSRAAQMKQRRGGRAARLNATRAKA